MDHVNFWCCFWWSDDQELVLTFIPFTRALFLFQTFLWFLREWFVGLNDDQACLAVWYLWVSAVWCGSEIWWAVLIGLRFTLIHGYQVWNWISLDWVIGECRALAEVCTLLRVILTSQERHRDHQSVQWQTAYYSHLQNENLKFILIWKLWVQDFCSFHLKGNENRFIFSPSGRWMQLSGGAAGQTHLLK